MSRFVKIGLLASTMLALASPALAEPGQDRDGGGGREWRGGGRGGQSGGGDGGERQRSWSPPAPAPQQAAPAREQRAPAVQNAPVPASAAPAAAQWRQQRDGNTPRPGAGNWQGGRNWNGERTPPAVSTPAPPQPRQEQRNWSRNDGTPGQRDWNRDDHRDRPDGRDNGTWNRGNDNWRQDNRERDAARDRDWQRRQQQGYNYQRRLQDRDRWADTRRWDNSWRSNGRYDWQRYRSLNRGFYHLPTYYAPYGWNRGYSRFSIGIFLSNVLFASDYWIDDPYEYRLPPAYGPLRWVRYYDDALLVDIRDGYVVDVIHDFFW